MSSGSESYRVVISARAGEVLVQHARFLAQVSPKAAEKLRLDVIEAAKSLQEFPERGNWLVDPALPVDKYRKLLVDKQYLLVYQVRNDSVYVDYVVDCRQDYVS